MNNMKRKQIQSDVDFLVNHTIISHNKQSWEAVKKAITDTGFSQDTKNRALARLQPIFDK